MKNKDKNSVKDEAKENEPIEQEIIDSDDADEKSGSEIEKLTKVNEELTDKLQRSLAEFDNFRKRTVKEKASMYNDGVISTIEKLIPVLDNFERALAAVPDKTDSMYKGIEMIYNQFIAIMNDIGVEPIECIGKEFSHDFHNAVSHEENAEYGSNIIMEELAKGYTYNGKVIRHSMVKVAN